MADLTVDDVLVRMRAILTATGAFTTVTSFPRQFNNDELPAAFVLPGEVTRTREGGDRVNDDRVYQILCFLSDVKLGGTGEKAQQALNYDIFEVVARAFDGRRTLQLNADDGIVLPTTEYIGDTGLQPVQFPPGGDRLYYGITFNIRVQRSFRQAQQP